VAMASLPRPPLQFREPPHADRRRRHRRR
jgi:hypothetical protein